LEQITAGIAPAVISNIHSANGRVFYDGKFNDIPNTVAAACREATRHGVTMLNVHALSGPDALEAAVKATKSEFEQNGPGAQRPLLLAVTILTSLNWQALVQIGLNDSTIPLDPSPKAQEHNDSQIVAPAVLRLALLAKECGLDGVIASPKEIGLIRQACGPDFLIVTPGVRPAGVSVGDQKRVMTPGEAIKAGADYLVIGRPILKPEGCTRVEAAQRIAEEIASVL